jgi:3-methyladenine DNA glycosylase AlkD
MRNIEQIRPLLQELVTIPKEKHSFFFKTQPGSYSEHDRFIGVTVPHLRKIAKDYSKLPLPEIRMLLESAFNEERFLALAILVDQYKKAKYNEKETLYDFYLTNLQYVNNWNLVDSSAHLIIGHYLFDKDKSSLLNLAKSNILWERRIAIISTWYFIRNNNLDWTFKIAHIFLKDSHDLIHKATGWMLREAGKKNVQSLIEYLNKYAAIMPRTMLRYSIEKFPENERKKYLMIR